MADVEEIKKRLDIVAIIGEYLTLKKAGVTYKALCPFHSERTPSFTVSPERNTWHCFGCGEGGDVISFVQKIDGLDFRETIERLAGRAGVVLDERPGDSAKRSEKSQIYPVMDMAARLYHELLLHHPSAEQARQYLNDRGVSDAMISQFKLGFAPNAWHTLDKSLTKKGLSPDLAWKSGLSIQKPNGDVYDRFRNRVMFPIDDVSGRIIGFTGRLLNDDSEQAKYVNTAESLVFKKSEAVYGISHAKIAIRDTHKAVLVEGQMDCIAAHQFGFTNTVAASGTALTADHIRLLKRYTDTVLFAFDADTAGQKAAFSAARICFELEVNPLFVRVPEGKDPDECIRHDAVLWRHAIESAVPAIDYFLADLLMQNPPKTAVAKKNVTRTLLPLVKLVKNAVEQAEYIHRIAGALGVPEASVKTDLDRTNSTHSDSEIGANTTSSTESSAPDPLDLERQVIGLCVAYYDRVPALPALLFENKALQQIYDLLIEAKRHSGGLNQFNQSVPKAWAGRLDKIVFETLRRHELLDSADIAQELIESLDRLRNRDRETRIASSAQAIAAAFSKGDVASARELLKSLDSDTISKE